MLAQSIRHFRRHHGIAPLLLAIALVASAHSAHAQSTVTYPGLSLERFDPAPAGDRMLGVPSPFAAGHLTPHAMLLLDYAHNPLVLRLQSNDEVIGAIVDNQLTLHLNASLALWNRLTLNLDAPLALVQTGDDPSGAGQTFPSPDAAQFGDLRLGARLRVWGGYYSLFQAALGASVWLPTGPQGSLVSDGVVRGMPQAIIGGRTRAWVWSFALGPQFRRSQTFAGVTQGSMLHLGAGIGYLIGPEQRLQIGPELTTAFVLKDVSAQSTNAELLFDVRYRFLRNIEAAIGLGPGLSAGIGTPDFRAVAMIAFTPEQPRLMRDRDKDGITDIFDACPDIPGLPSNDPKKRGCPQEEIPVDRDHDTIVDSDDACPDLPGIRSSDPKQNGCPPPDKDRDGIVDDIDACPDVAGVLTDNPKTNGCPPDRDGDSIADAQDACPDVAGVPSLDPKKNGCPPDKDEDGIPDAQDACPNEKGGPDVDPEKNGCPKQVRVTETEVVILQQVQFDTNLATIKKESDPLLDEVAQVLKDHPEFTKVEVQGHTDIRGGKVHNKILSQARADSVAKALVERGIDVDRLVPKGYGMEQPIDDNKTEAGRQNNRRVQFKIVEKLSKKQ